MRIRGRNVTLRLQLASATEVRRRGYVARALTPDLAVVPAWQDDLGMQILTTQRLAGRDPDEAFALARRHPLGGFGPIERRRLGNGAVLWLQRGGNPWVATSLLDLGAWIEAHVTDQWFEPQVGALVAVPTRSTLYVHLLNTHDGVIDTMSALAALAATGFHTTAADPWSADVHEIVPRPEPLGPCLYWWKHGQLAIQPSRVDLHAATVVVAPTRAFRDEVLAPMGVEDQAEPT